LLGAEDEDEDEKAATASSARVVVDVDARVMREQREDLSDALAEVLLVDAARLRRVLFSHWSPYDRVGVVNADP
jgi:hypothetical protein